MPGKTFGDSNDERSTIRLNVPHNVLRKFYEFSTKPKFLPAYYGLDPDEIRNFNNALKPILERGGAIYRPSRIIFDFKKEKPNDGHINYFHVNPDSSFSEWNLIDEPDRQYSIPLVGDSNSNFASYLFNLTIPYIDNISISELNKILVDETDLLKGFRAELKRITNQALQDKKELIEIKEDILQPRLDKINRKFKEIQRMKTFKNAGVIVTSGVLSLLSLYTDGAISAVTKALGIAGAGGLLSNDSASKGEIDKLKDDSLYLLWKLKVNSTKPNKM